LIISVDGRQVNEFNDMLSYMILELKVPGDTMTVTVLRNGEALDLVITLGKRP